MKKKRIQTGFRLDTELLERLDAFRHAREEVTPGLEVTRTDAIRILLEKGLEESGFPDSGRKKIKVGFNVTCMIEVDEAILEDAMSEEFAKDFYRFDTEQAVAEHLAYNMLRGASLSTLDGFAQFHDDKAKLTDENWEPE